MPAETNVTGRDGLIVIEALAFSYAAMKHLPQMFRPLSNMRDARTLPFSWTNFRNAEWTLGQAILLAWNLRADVPPTAGRTIEAFHANLRRIRELVLQEPSEDDDEAEDTALLVRHIDVLLAVRQEEG